MEDRLLDLIHQDLEKSGLDQKTLEDAGIKVFDGDRKILQERLGRINLDGQPILQAFKLLEIPYFNEAGEIILYRYKLYPATKSKDGKDIKYLHPLNKPARPYILPEVWKIKDKPNKPIWITEGEKKALKLLQSEEYAIALSGVWNFKAGKDSEFKNELDLFKELKSFSWKGRIVYLAFDMDLWTNPMVRQALWELALKLYALGAVVKVATWDAEKGKGIDDYLANEPDGLPELKKDSKSLTDFISEEHSQAILKSLSKVELPNIQKKIFDKALKDKLGITAEDTEEEKTKKLQGYFIDDKGYLCRWKGDLKQRLCNFDAKISKEILEDNGAEQRLLFSINGKTIEEELSTIEVETKKFPELKWVSDWGNKAVIEAGANTKDFVRHAIQVRSGRVERITCYTHLGWRTINNCLTYLSGSGGIGGEAKVKLARELERYSLPTEIKNEEEALKISLEMLDIAPVDFTIPLLSLVFITPLTTLLEIEPNFIFYIYGETGVKKSTIATLTLNYFGDFPSIDTLPNFSDTANSLEKIAFTLKDTLMVIDDYHPTFKRGEQENIENKAQRLIRAFANRTGRGRLNPDATEKDRYEPRGMLIITGEDIVSLQSTLARCFVLELGKDTINLPKLTELQKKRKLLTYAMTSYILWIRENIETIKTEFTDNFYKYRSRASDEELHARLPEQVAFLYFGLTTFLKFFIEKGIISQKEADEYSSLGWDILVNKVRNHNKRIKAEDPVEKVREILESLLLQKKIRIDPKEAGPVMGGDEAILLGWYDTDFYYLLPKALWHELNDFCRREGSYFPLSERTFREILGRRGIIEIGQEDRTTPLEWIRGKGVRVLKFFNSKFPLLQKNIREK